MRAGSYPEGPGYGDFAISHHIAALRGIETALGTSLPNLNVSGLAQIPRYYVGESSNALLCRSQQFLSDD